MKNLSTLQNELKYLEAKESELIEKLARARAGYGLHGAITCEIRAELKAVIAKIVDIEIAIKYGDYAKDAVKTNKNYGYNIHAMCKNLTIKQLEAMLPVIRREHATKDGIHLVDKKGRWKIDQVTWAIYHLTKEAV